METSTLGIFKATCKLGFSLSISRLLNILSMFIGTMMISRLGHYVLAASALITSLQATALMLGMSLLFSVGLLVARANGSKDYQKIGKLVQQGLILATILAFLVVILVANIHSILTFFGQRKEIILVNDEYFKTYIFAIPAFFWSMVYTQFLLSINKQFFVIIMSAFSLAVSLLLAYAFVYGHFGAPKLGVSGLGLAYAIQAWLSLIGYFLFCHLPKGFRKFQINFKNIKKNFILMKTLFKLGFPICLQASSDLFSFSFTTVMVGWLGVDALAAQQIVTQYFMLLVVPVFALSQASAILVGKAHGAREYNEVRHYARIGLAVGLFFGAIIMFIFIYDPKALVRIYFHDETNISPALIHLAIIVLIMTGCRLFFDIIAQIRAGSLRGLLDTSSPMKVSFASAWIIGVPISYILAFYFHIGLIGMTIGGICSVVFSAVILNFRWYHKSTMENLINFKH